MKPFTTIEKLQLDSIGSNGAVLKYNDHVLFTYCNWKGEFTGEVYEFIETPEETGLGDIECRLNCIKVSTEVFADGGHAIEWCLKQI